VTHQTREGMAKATSCTMLEQLRPWGVSR